MEKVSAIVLLVAIYVAAAALSWLGVGRWVWDGSGPSQVLTPATMTLLTVVVAEVSLLGVRRLSRKNHLAPHLAAVLAMLLAAALLVVLNG